MGAPGASLATIDTSSQPIEKRLTGMPANRHCSGEQSPAFVSGTTAWEAAIRGIRRRKTAFLAEVEVVNHGP